MTGLQVLEVGQGPERLVFLHGLFGQGKNFGTVAKLLGEDATSVLVDLPNHGRSPWTDYFDYHLFADLLAGELVERGAGREPVTLVGHSMGGKVAMQLTLSHPRLVDRLVVIDMSPVDRGDPSEFQHYADAMSGLDLSVIGSRAQADAALSVAVPNQRIRSFLLQNLHRSDSSQGWRWLPNLKLLGASMGLMSGWPDQQKSMSPSLRKYFSGYCPEVNFVWPVTPFFTSAILITGSPSGVKLMFLNARPLIHSARS